MSTVSWGRDATPSGGHQNLMVFFKLEQKMNQEIDRQIRTVVQMLQHCSEVKNELGQKTKGHNLPICLCANPH